MRTVKWNAFLSGLCGVAVALGVLAGSARADVVTEKSASILAFPKVIANTDRDTIIQISNTSNSMVHARCFYVDAQLPSFCTREDPRVGCTPTWQETDFSIWLTRQQPTHWVVSSGRPVDPSDDYCSALAPTDLASGATSSPTYDWLAYEQCLNGAGFDPGAVPPVTSGFQGELKCVEVDFSGAPIGGNHLKGEATLITKADGDVSKYNAIGIQGTEFVGATGNVLLLNNPRGETSGEYNACPETLILNHFTEGASNPVLDEFERGRGGLCSVTNSIHCLQDSDCPATETCAGTSTVGGITTELTLIPCSEDFETQTPGTVTIQFLVFNEFEERFSTSTTVTCWKNVELSDIDSPNDATRSIFSYARLGSLVAQTRITPADIFDGAVIGVAEATHEDRDANKARAAVNIVTEGDRIKGTDFAGYDQIVLPNLF
jgi:hypothetical protein